MDTEDAAIAAKLLRRTARSEAQKRSKTRVREWSVERLVSVSATERTARFASAPRAENLADGTRHYVDLRVQYEADDASGDPQSQAFEWSFSMSPGQVRWLRWRAWIRAAIRLPGFLDMFAPLALIAFAIASPWIFKATPIYACT